MRRHAVSRFHGTGKRLARTTGLGKFCQMHRYLSGLLLPLCAVASACGRRVPDLPPLSAAAYADTIAAFHKYRLNAIAGPTGWATLIGLWWVKPGETRIGADPSSTIMLPKA